MRAHVIVVLCGLVGGAGCKDPASFPFDAGTTVMGDARVASDVSTQADSVIDSISLESCDEHTDCQDGDPCTVGVCDEGSCRYSALCPETLCSFVECVPGPPGPGAADLAAHCIGTPKCDDGDPFTFDACDPNTGECSHEFQCVNADQCSDGDPCTVDTCDGGSCEHTQQPDGAPCEGGDPCVVNAQCIAGACTGGSPLCPDVGCVSFSCSDGTCVVAETQDCPDDSEAGTFGECDPLTGECLQVPACDVGPCESADSQCVKTALPDGTPCDDTDACTTAAQCQSGGCTGVETIDCDDSDSCTSDSCDPKVGCTHEPVPGCGESTLCELQGSAGSTVVCEVVVVRDGFDSPPASGVQFVAHWDPALASVTALEFGGGCPDSAQCEDLVAPPWSFTLSGHTVAANPPIPTEVGLPFDWPGQVSLLVAHFTAPETPLNDAWWDGAIVVNNGYVFAFRFQLLEDVVPGELSVSVTDVVAADGQTLPLSVVVESTNLLTSAP